MKYKIDYARSGRSTCRGCQSRQIDNNKIEHGTLRIAINEQVINHQLAAELKFFIQFICLYLSVRSIRQCLRKLVSHRVFIRRFE